MSLAIFSPESLRRLAEMEICKHLWAQYRMRKILKKNLTEALMRRKPDPEALTQVCTNIDNLPLPKSRKDDLKVLAKATGLVIWKWLDKLKSKPYIFFGGLSRYIDYFKWTSDWTIDSVETMRSMYYSKVFPDTKETWTELSYYCLKDCLEDFYGRVKLMDYDSFQSELYRGHSDYIRKLLSFYWAKFMQNRLDQCAAYLNSLRAYDYRATLDTKMLVLLDTESIAAKYFWQQQATTEKWCGSPYFYQLVSWHGFDFVIYKEQYDGISSMIEDRIIDDRCILEKIVYWPWEDFALFTTSFRTLLSEVGPKEVAEIITPRFCETVLENRSWYDDDNISDRIYAIFQIIWSAMDDKTKVDTSSWDVTFTISALSTEDECLKVLLQDRALSGHKWMIMDSIVEEFCRYVYNSTLVERFCAEVLSDDEDRALFMELCNDRRVYLDRLRQ